MEVRKDLPMLTSSKGVVNQRLWRARKRRNPHEGRPCGPNEGWGQGRCWERWPRLEQIALLTKPWPIQGDRQTTFPSFPSWSFPVSHLPSASTLTQPSSPALPKHIAPVPLRRAFWTALPREQAGRQPQLSCACVARGSALEPRWAPLGPLVGNLHR